MLDNGKQQTDARAESVDLRSWTKAFLASFLRRQESSTFTLRNSMTNQEKGH